MHIYNFRAVFWSLIKNRITYSSTMDEMNKLNFLNSCYSDTFPSLSFAKKRILMRSRNNILYFFFSPKFHVHCDVMIKFPNRKILFVLDIYLIQIGHLLFFFSKKVEVHFNPGVCLLVYKRIVNMRLQCRKKVKIEGGSIL